MSVVPLSPTVTGILAAIIAFTTYLAVDIMGFFNRSDKLDFNGKTVLLTGGSQGMGKSIAKILAKKGANVVIVARNQAKLDEALAEIKASARSASQRFHAISADVTDPDESTRILAETTTWASSPPDIVWANAGAATPGLYADTSIATLRSQMDINFWGAAYLSHAALSLFTKPASGAPSPGPPRHIVMTSSTVAYVGLAGYGPYAPAKAAMRSLADTLRSEVLLYNGARRAGKPGAPERDLRVHIVMPGTILTEGFDTENKTKHAVTRLLEEADPKQSADEAAAAAVRGLERGEFMVTTQWLGNFMRTSSLGGSMRTSIVVDTVMSWVAAVVWLFVGPDLDGKVWNYGKKNGVESKKT